MAELEQALRDLADDPTLAPEPLTAIEARAAQRRRRRRGQGGGAVVTVVVVVLFVGIAAFVDDRPQVVSAANTGADGASKPSLTGPGGAPATTAAVSLPARPGDIIDTTQATPALPPGAGPDDARRNPRARVALALAVRRPGRAGGDDDHRARR